MIDINSIGKIRYKDLSTTTFPGEGDNVISLEINGKPVDFGDAAKYYSVSTVNYLAAGSCNFNDGGVSLWPLGQITHDTQYYVRDAVIDYVKAMGTVSPKIEGRLQFYGPEVSLSSDDMAGRYDVNVSREFHVAAANFSGSDVAPVIAHYKVANTQLSDISAFEYYDGSAWQTMPMSQSGSDVVGYFGPPAGFPMPDGYFANTLFRVTFAKGGTYNVTMTLDDASTEDTRATLNQTVVVYAGSYYLPIIGK
jgi:hypothetical protein